MYAGNRAALAHGREDHRPRFDTGATIGRRDQRVFAQVGEDERLAAAALGIAEHLAAFGRQRDGRGNRAARMQHDALVAAAARANDDDRVGLHERDGRAKRAAEKVGAALPLGGAPQLEQELQCLVLPPSLR